MTTTKIKKVLIAMDYDPTSKKVAESGFEMAKAIGAEITLVHVMINKLIYVSSYANMGAWQIDAVESF